MDSLTDLGAALRDFLNTFGLLAIFAVMLIKEFGVPVPVPSDPIMITAGVQAASGGYSLLALALAIEFAMLVGGSAQFLLARAAGRPFVYRAGRLIGLTPERLDRALGMLQQRGALAVFLGLNVPGARAGIIPAAGLVGMPYPAFTPAMVGGSSVFYGWHIALGYLVGPSAVMLLERLNLPIGPVLAGLAGVPRRPRRRTRPSTGCTHGPTPPARPVWLSPRCDRSGSIASPGPAASPAESSSTPPALADWRTKALRRTIRPNPQHSCRPRIRIASAALLPSPSGFTGDHAHVRIHPPRVRFLGASH